MSIHTATKQMNIMKHIRLSQNKGRKCAKEKYVFSLHLKTANDEEILLFI